MIEVHEKDGLVTVTINRPDKANSLTAEMLADLVDAMKGARDAPAVILTGRGKVFSAGADLEAAKAGLAVSPLWEELSAAVAALNGLSVVALNGTLAGGAFGMALACDLRIAVPEARFFYPVMKLGFLPQPSDPGRLCALVGPSRAKLILMAAQKIDADEALAMGLIDRIVPGENLMPAAHDLIAAVCSAPPDIARGIKKLCQNG